MNNEQLSHLSNLIALAHADNVLDENEIKLIKQIGLKMGFSDLEISSMINQKEEKEFVFPEKETERYHQLYELVSMIMIDGFIHNKEVELLKKYARKLKFEDHIIDPLIEKIKEFLNLGYEKNRIQTNISDLINKI